MRFPRTINIRNQRWLTAVLALAVAMPWFVSILMLPITGCGDDGQAGDDGLCQNQCTEGARDCHGNGFRLCTVLSSGCTGWSDPEPCPAGQICSDGSCVADCSDQCTGGATQCSRFEVQTCKKMATGCLDWDAAVPCPEGELCLADSCVDGQGIAYWEKVYTTPDYLQTDTDYGGLPGDGEKYCAPVAVSNALMWLDDNGFDKLASNTDDRKKDQFDLISLLGSSDYMNIDVNGTNRDSTIAGLQKHLDSLGYTSVEIKYQGRGSANDPYYTGVQLPELDWIKQNVQGKTAMWLIVGWYLYDASTDTYDRWDGHALTVVGYGFDENQVDPNYLVLHDPGQASGIEFANEHVLTEKLESGVIIDDSGWKRPAAGYYKLTEGMHIPVAPLSVAILDSVVVLRME